jgi:hypothetical protein
MAPELSFCAFAERKGRTFRVSCEGMQPVEMELMEVTDLTRPDQSLPNGVRQDPFQLKFRGPTEPILPQSVYDFACEGEGIVQLFLVPHSRSGDHTLYNVVVN